MPPRVGVLRPDLVRVMRESRSNPIKVVRLLPHLDQMGQADAATLEYSNRFRLTCPPVVIGRLRLTVVLELTDHIPVGLDSGETQTTGCPRRRVPNASDRATIRPRQAGPVPRIPLVRGTE